MADKQTVNYSTLEEVQLKIDETKDIMHDNIIKVQERGEKIEVLADKTYDLSQHAELFKKKSTKLKWIQKCKNWKLTGCIICGILTVMIIIIIIAESSKK